ncbi:MAG: hypothetical protein DLM50_05655 [Candidatus Meridianibacter frigidus]|nr:MAG: hypothetical protein DLM50_05655 [Candidatus Eremiobacteraeota bacterium]
MQSNALPCSLLLAAALVSAAPRPACGATVPAITAFEGSFARINDYTVTTRAHDVLGTAVQDRTYHFLFKKPNKARIDIVNGPGRGGGGVWNGGDRVSGHRGGLLSRFRLKVSLHDSRATSLRGYTIIDALIQNEVAQYRNTRGELIQKRGGGGTDEVELKLAAPALSGADRGVTRMAMWFSKRTGWPVRQIRWEGNKVATEENWTDLRLDAGLPDGDFAF